MLGRLACHSFGAQALRNSLAKVEFVIVKIIETAK
jgi:hypothetical protein